MFKNPQKESENSQTNPEKSSFSAPSLSLPKGGGAIRGIGEKFAANPVNGTGSLSVPIFASPGRSGFSPQLSLSYDSGSGNGSFGFGWSISLPAITRKTDKGLPQYLDTDESDVFILSGAEDLVPVLKPNGKRDVDTTTVPGYTIHRYRPRIEGLFARIERWTNQSNNDVHWRSISKDNILTLYGKDNNARVFDPADPDQEHLGRIFSWLICQSYDDKGNAIIYKYAAEDDQDIDHAQANERNRVRGANRYLKRIIYGNRTPNRDNQGKATDPALLPANNWMFEVVFDYGEHNTDAPRPEEPNLWPRRPDPFSSYRPGFEVRTYRRCHRVLMFHRFAELGNEACLVHSTEFEYADLNYDQTVTIEAELAHRGSTRFASFIHSVTQSGYVWQPDDDTYLKKFLPPIEFEYTIASIQDDIRELDVDSLENLPIGLDGATYQWVDLNGEGVSGILTEQSDTWFYKSNLGEGRFAPQNVVALKPSLANLSNGRQQLLDLEGDGQLDLAVFTAPTPGFYERTHNESWESFKTFRHLPNIRWEDPNLRFVDLNGDGHADVLITEHKVFTWHPSLAEDGFDTARHVFYSSDEEKAPHLVFADGTQSIYLADMCGDSLTDLVRIRNGEISYWPNLGYGRFGAKVTMDNAPWFDHPDQFSHRRIRLADIDGSGTNDIIYLGRDSVHLYFNQSGNRWSEPRHLRQFPHIHDLSSVMTADLLGNGTACLVWSSPLPGDARRPTRYIDLMGGQKPNLLVKSINNLGMETRVHYAPSTKFYLKDKRDGKSWVTRLPFPVHVVERVETYDYISRNRFVTRYEYHHGYFDGEEREFRGFGLVEQWDTEEFAAITDDGTVSEITNFNAASHVPPVLTRTWFHTGVYVGRDRVSNFFAGLLDEHDRGVYYREPIWRDNNVEARKRLLPDTVMPSNLTLDEEREACRALKGVMLRQEVYALDKTGTDDYPYGHPYTVVEQNFNIRHLQPRDGNRHAVFFTHPGEAISYHYERNPVDPRISHTLTLEVDTFGNVLKEAAIGYGRRQPDLNLPARYRTKQTQTLITYTEHRFTEAIADSDSYRTPMPCETRTYELTGYTRAVAPEQSQFSDFVKPDPNNSNRLIHIFDTEISYETLPTNGKQRRLIEHVRTLYRKDDLTTFLPLGTAGSLALPGESYKLALTPSLLNHVFKRKVDGQPDENLLPNPTLLLEGKGADRGGYVNWDGNWWIPSGRVFFDFEANVSNPALTAV